MDALDKSKGFRKYSVWRPTSNLTSHDNVTHWKTVDVIQGNNFERDKMILWSGREEGKPFTLTFYLIS